MVEPPPPTRLATAVALAALALLALGVGAWWLVSTDDIAPDPGEVDEPDAAPVPNFSPPTTVVPTTLPPAPPSYEPLPGEPVADAKLAAARAIELLTTYDPSPQPAVQARERLAAAGIRPEIVDAAAELLAPGEWSRGEIVYPQLGGLTETQASVMVVVRQERANVVASRTIDVRLSTATGAWAVDAIASIGDVLSGPASAPAGSRAATVLSLDSLDLPDSARADIASGAVDDRVLSVLEQLGGTHRLSIATIIAGHPTEVFATTRTSNHTVGRAVDVWAIDGVPVVSLRNDPAATQALLRQLLAEGVGELGAPWALGGVSFTDTVHQDHVHIGYDG